jgi:hypothetical protein
MIFGKLMMAKKAKFLPIVAVGLIMALGGSHLFMYQKGKENEKVAAAERMIAALEEQRKRIESIHSQEMALVESQFKSEQVIVERIREVEVFVSTPMCEDLGADWLREYNRAIGAASGTSTNP